MPINFPNSPSPNQLYTYDNKTWEYNGIYWEVYSALTSYVGGTGTTQTIPKWSNTNTLTDSQIVDNGSFVGVGYGTPYVANSTFGASIIESGYFQFVGNGNSNLAITDSDYTSWGAGTFQIALGSGSPLGISQGDGNIGIGYSSLYNNFTGKHNIGIGYEAGYSNSSGYSNVFIGYRAGFSTTGDSNVFIGPNAGYNETGSGKLYIANNSSSPLIYGDFNTNNVGINGTLSATTYQNLPYSGTVTSITLSAGTSGSDFNISNSAITTSGTITLNIPNAGSASRGLVTTGTQTFAGVKTFLSAPNLSSLTPNQILALDNLSNVQSLTTTTYPSLTELSYVKGVTSAIQTQINSKGSGTVTSVTLSAGTSGTDVNIQNSTITTSGTITINIPDASATARGLVTTGTQTIAGRKNFLTAPNFSSLTASQILALDSSNNVQTLDTVTYPSLTELSYVKGVTSAIQTQLNSRLATSGGTINGNLTVTGLTTSSSLNVTGTTTLNQLGLNQLVATDAVNNLISLSTTTYPSFTELSYVKGVTSAIQTQLNAKGTVSSVALSAGTSGTDVNISNSAVTSSGTITINIPDASATARGLITTGTQTIGGSKTINGNLTVTGNTTINGLTASQIVATDTNKTLVSLDTATYPSLTELTYVKGVTSSLQTQLNGKEPTITNGYGISGTTTKQVSLTSTQVFATATTTISLATYADIAGCSVTLAAGTWLITGHVVVAFPNQSIQAFVAITDAANTVYAASATRNNNTGTAGVSTPFAVSWSVIVTPNTSTTYKLRGARGVTNLTGNYTVYNGTGYNTVNQSNDNSNLGTNILAIRIA